MRVTLLRCLIIIVASFASVSAQQFEAEGTLRYEAFGGSSSFLLDKQFTISRSGCEWIIRTWNSNETDDPHFIYKYQEIGFDGTDLYKFSVTDLKRLPEDAKSSPDGKRVLYAHGEVRPGVVPTPDESFVFAVWMALGSGCYFGSITNNLVKPLMFREGDFAGDSYLVQAHWEFNATAPAFLDQVVMLSDGKARGVGPDGKTVIRPYPPPWNTGFTNLVFRASNFREFSDNLRIPSRFALEMFAVTSSPDSSEPRRQMVARMTGEVITAASIESFSPLPSIVSEAAITDWRTGGSYTLQYFSEKWYSRDDPELARMHERFVRGNPHMLGEEDLSFRKRLYILLCLMVVTGVGIGYVLMSRQSVGGPEQET